MNQSIYLMVSVPYLALGIFGFLIYRGCKQNAAYREALAKANGTTPIVLQSGSGGT